MSDDVIEYEMYRGRVSRFFSRCAKSSLMADAKELGKSPRYLVAVYVIAFLDSLSYYAFSYALIMHLGTEVGVVSLLRFLCCPFNTFRV